MERQVRLAFGPASAPARGKGKIRRPPSSRTSSESSGKLAVSLLQEPNRHQFGKQRRWRANVEIGGRSGKRSLQIRVHRLESCEVSSTPKAVKTLQSLSGLLQPSILPVPVIGCRHLNCPPPRLLHGLPKQRPKDPAFWWCAAIPCNPVRPFIGDLDLHGVGPGRIALLHLFGREVSTRCRRFCRLRPRPARSFTAPRSSTPFALPTASSVALECSSSTLPFPRKTSRLRWCWRSRARVQPTGFVPARPGSVGR